MRMDPEGANLVPKALAPGMLLTGWSRARELVKLVDQAAFKEHGILTYFPDARRPWTPGQVAWISGAYRFMHQMKPGDLVVVPHQDHFYIACVTGAATYVDGVADDSAHRRPAAWLAGPIPRTAAQEMRQSFFYAGTCCSLDKHRVLIYGLLNRYGYPGWAAKMP
jgi:predicted Mrr-cat superfamily restriction endonuclease